MTPNSTARCGVDRLRSLKFLVRHLALWSFLAFTVYWIWLDYSVGRLFGARQWAIPGRLFASPVELYQGLELDRDYLETTLLRLGYKRSISREMPGNFNPSSSSFKVFTRGFEFPEGAEPARRISIGFDNDLITSIADVATGDPVALTRLEPVEIGSIHGDVFEDRMLLPIADIPYQFLEILLAVEDRRFHQHIGVDPIGILRAVLSNLVSGRIEQGASTITQQLVKNMYLSNERTYGRKVREALMAISLERRYSKADIVEAYVNEIFLGQDGNRAIHGFGLGARYYFGKPLADLDVAESAMLVGMVKAPSAYNPMRHSGAARKRRDLVLNLLLDQGLIDRKVHSDVSSHAVLVQDKATVRPRDYGAFIDLVRIQLKRDYRDLDLRQAGLNIFTTLDLFVQHAAQDATLNRINDIESKRDLDPKSLQGAVIVIDSRTAELRGLVGGRDVLNTGFNRALNARRPIGSLVKPFVYLAALEQTERFNVLSTIDDDVVNLTDSTGAVWSPSNYDGKLHGKISLREALVRSYNLATVDLGLKVGVKRIIHRLQEMGVKHDLQDLPSLLLGAIELTPVEVAGLYQAVANDGFKVPLRAIRSVADAQNKTLTRYAPRVEQVVEAAPAYLLQYLLTGVVAQGTGRAVANALPDRLPLAGKTGTSNDGRDSWFAGFGGNLLTVVWVGRDDNGETGLTGASGALKIWATLMQHIGVVPFQLGRPANLRWEWVTSTGNAIVPERCLGATHIPLALPHGLPTRPDCGDAPSKRSKLWDRVREIFH